MLMLGGRILHLFSAAPTGTQIGAGTSSGTLFSYDERRILALSRKCTTVGYALLYY